MHAACKKGVKSKRRIGYFFLARGTLSQCIVFFLYHSVVMNKVAHYGSPTADDVLNRRVPVPLATTVTAVSNASLRAFPLRCPSVDLPSRSLVDRSHHLQAYSSSQHASSPRTVAQSSWWRCDIYFRFSGWRHVCS